jgi:hypothetical protein
MSPLQPPSAGPPAAFSASLRAALNAIQRGTEDLALRTERIADLFTRLGVEPGAPQGGGADEPRVTLPADLHTRCDARGVTLPTFTTGTAEEAYAWAEAVALTWRRVAAYGQMTRAPHPVAGALLDARAGRLAIASPPALTLDARRQPFHPAQPRDRSGKTFVAAKLDAQYWDLITPRGLYRPRARGAAREPEPGHVQLVLPFERGVRPARDTAGVRVRAKLTAGMLRAWLAAWWLADRWIQTHDRHADLGLFALDTRAVLHELYGLSPTRRTVGGKTYLRPPVSAERSFLGHFQGLQEVFIRGIGQGPQRITPRDPERVITFLEDGAGRRRIYRHATLAVILMRNAFLQIPTAALRLEPEDTPLVLGLAALWRDRMARHVLRGAGHYQTTLAALAEQCGEDWTAGARHDGRAYWPRLAARLVRVMEQGELGQLHLAGEGPDATATLTPSDALATVYSSLVQDPAPPGAGTPRPRPRPRK